MKYMRRLKYVLRSKIACFVVAGAVLVLFWGAAIYNIYQESQGSISDLSELWSYISEQGLMFLFGAWGFVSFLVSGFQAKKASEADRAERGRCGYDGADIGTGYEYGERDAGAVDGAYGYTYTAYGTSGYPVGYSEKTNEFSLQSGTRKISFELPQRYRLIDGDDGDPAFAGFNEEHKPELVYCSLQEAIDDETAEAYVLDELVEEENCPKELRSKTFLKQEVIDGKLYYYYIFTYKKSRKRRQKFAAACDIGGGLFYTIETEWIWREEELALDALMHFLRIKIV